MKDIDIDIDIDIILQIEDVSIKEFLLLAYFYYYKKYNDIFKYIQDIKDDNFYLHQKYHAKLFLQQKYLTTIEKLKSHDIRSRVILNQLPEAFIEVRKILSRYNAKEEIEELVKNLDNNKSKYNIIDIELFIDNVNFFKDFVDFCNKDGDLNMACRILMFEYIAGLLTY